MTALLTLLAILTQGGEYAFFLWMAYGVFSSFGTLAYSQTAAGFPSHLSGRANATFNLMVFLGAFGLQWGMGLLIEWLGTLGFSVAAAHRNTFLALLILQATALAWLLWPRRYRTP